MKKSSMIRKATILAATPILAAMMAVTCDPASGSFSADSGGTDGGGGGGGGNGVVGAYPIVDTNQTTCYDNFGAIACPAPGQAFHGQDASHAGNAPRYADNGDGTVTDLVTGLMWQRDPGEKMTWEEGEAGAAVFSLAGYDDWRMPTIKELYSLMDFSGYTGMAAADSEPYLDMDYFVFEYGDESAGERFIDSQYWSATTYVSATMGGNETAFGVNFADGRIKGYPKYDPRLSSGKLNYVLYVRGNPDYGNNLFGDNGDGTISDLATGLMWMRLDSGDMGAGVGGQGAMLWADALSWCEGLEYAGYGDWRLPDAKELESIVDYTRSPATAGTAAIDPLFSASPIIDEGGAANYAFYWSGTTHVEGDFGDHAAYVAFGEALGFMEEPPGSANYTLMDVHGAGAQRSDPKTGDPDDYPYGFGPQGDVRRIYNFARCVRDIDAD